MLELRILTGLHRGAALPLEGDAIRIGSGADNDIVLLDPGMPEYAGALARDDASHWRYRPGGAPRADHGSAANAASPHNDIPLINGARWFAGPVLLGSDDEGSPWPVEPVPPFHPSARAQRRSTRIKLILAAAVTIAAAGLIAAFSMLAARTEPTAASRLSAAKQSAGGVAPPAAPPEPREKQASAPKPVRVAKGMAYPSDAVTQPPFAIRSVKGGPYGFLVTEDGRVLVPGSRWKAFTLVRIESGRAVFSGPHAAEVRW
ncbi:FHA domain-containing protein [Trinickia sp.]|uniref:FHA domain-containing protein n=1 Tax=Trinickia sp. TaxID=2571163 RepID=UPI003F7EE633